MTNIHLSVIFLIAIVLLAIIGLSKDKESLLIDILILFFSICEVIIMTMM